MTHDAFGLENHISFQRHQLVEMIQIDKFCFSTSQVDLNFTLYIHFHFSSNIHGDSFSPLLTPRSSSRGLCRLQLARCFFASLAITFGNPTHENPRVQGASGESLSSWKCFVTMKRVITSTSLFIIYIYIYTIYIHINTIYI